jgi:hypothetical protein
MFDQKRPKENWSKFPNWYTDKMMRLLTGDELKTLLFATRAIFGWSEQLARPKISITRFCNGDPELGEEGTGLSRADQHEAIKNLVKYGFLLEVIPGSGRRATYYGISMEHEDLVDYEGLEKRLEERKSRGKKRADRAADVDLQEGAAAEAAEDLQDRSVHSQGTLRAENQDPSVLSQGTLKNPSVHSQGTLLQSIPYIKKEKKSKEIKGEDLQLKPRKVKTKKTPTRTNNLWPLPTEELQVEPEAAGAKEAAGGADLVWNLSLEFCDGKFTGSDLSASDRRGKIWMLQDHFRKATILPYPDYNDRGIRTLENSWWTPIYKILELCNWDLDFAKKEMAATIEQMDERGYTITCPGSVEKMATAAIAKSKRSKNVAPAEDPNAHYQKFVHEFGM